MTSPTDQPTDGPETGPAAGLGAGLGAGASSLTPEELTRLRRARDLMDRDYTQPLDVPAVARAAYMSPSHFSRLFRAAYDETPYGYLSTRRIERAKALLRHPDASVTDVCMEVGFSSLSSFSSRFSELVGETPSAYRDRVQRDAAAATAIAQVPACFAKAWGRPSRFGQATRSRAA